MSDSYRVSIERLENGFEVTVPDVPAIEAAEKAAEKNKGKGGAGMCSPYTGDMTKSYAAATVPDVIKIIETALKSIPQQEYESAFAEAARMANGED